MKRRTFISAITALPALTWADKALAHRELLTTTEIEWSNSSQTLDITHIFHIHHAEKTLQEMGVIPDRDLQNLKNQARLAIYTEDNFSLKTASGAELKLSSIGAETDGANVYVYQECPTPKPPESLLVSCAFLRPAIASQINEIHLNIHNRISTIRMSGRQTQKLLIAK